MTSGQYWKIKALELERIRFEGEIKQAADQLRSKLEAAYTDAGLEFGKAYQFDDAAETMTEPELGPRPVSEN